MATTIYNDRVLYKAGVNIYYRVYPGNQELEPVFFVHGWAGSSLDWEPLVEHYQKEGHTCLVFDAPGFGKSQFDTKAASRHADYSIERYVSYIRELIELENFRKIRLVGHSWGGVIAMAYAAANPESVSNLVVIGGAYFDPQNPVHQIFKWISWLIVGIIVITKPFLKKYKKFRRLAVRRYTYRPLNEADAELIMADVLLSDNRTLNRTLLGGYQVDFKSLCPAITVPTFYIGGQYDAVAAVQFVKPFVELTPISSYAVIADCGHFPMQERPDKLIEAISGFWETTKSL